MTSLIFLALVRGAIHLGLAFVAFRRRARASLGVPLGILCVLLYCWSTAGYVHRVTGAEEYRLIDLSLSPFTGPLAAYFAAAFIGARRRFTWLLIALFAVATALSALGFAALFMPHLRSFANSDRVLAVHLALAGCVTVFAVWHLVKHRAQTKDPDERLRTQIVLAAFAVAAAFGTTGVWNDLGFDVPHLEQAGVTLAVVLVGFVALRFDLLESEPSSAVAIYAFALGLVAVAMCITVWAIFKTSAAVLLVAMGVAGVFFVLALRPALARVTTHRARRERLTVMGRMSDQLAHDLKNPLAAVKGAWQVLEMEREQTGSLDGQMELFDLMGEQLDRLARVIDKYQRVGRLEPARGRVDLREVSAKLVELAQQKGVLVTLEDGDALPLQCDEDLIGVAIENLVQNAAEASGTETPFTVRVARQDGQARVTVSDKGPGISARDLERAFDDFFTTKEQGSGLGLPFVRRIAEAHGGRLSLTSVLGEGTSATIVLPCEAENADE